MKIANSVFDSDSHESEQMTMVFEGVLYFDADGRVYPVKAGDIIAIPSNIVHAVYTKLSAVKAVDAWSPIMNKCLTKRSRGTAARAAAPRYGNQLNRSTRYGW